jgi:hypothetical protein
MARDEAEIAIGPGRFTFHLISFAIIYKGSFTAILQTAAFCPNGVGNVPPV